MNADALNLIQGPDGLDPEFKRKKRHLAGIAVGFLFPLVLFWWAWQRHFSDYVLFPVAVAGIPLVFVGFRSWRRWFYPDRLPIRWAEDLVAYKRLRIVGWATYGLNAAVGTVAVLMSFGHEASRHTSRWVWLAAWTIAGIRMILMQYIEDRKPLLPPVESPVASPYDPSLRLTNPVRPVYSKDWDNY